MESQGLNQELSSLISWIFDDFLKNFLNFQKSEGKKARIWLKFVKWNSSISRNFSFWIGYILSIFKIKSFHFHGERNSWILIILFQDFLSRLILNFLGVGVLWRWNSDFWLTEPITTHDLIHYILDFLEEFKMNALFLNNNTLSNNE